MKIQVIVKHSAKAQVSSSLEFAVNPGDTVLAMKERISLAVSTPFPKQDLIFEAVALQDEQRLGDCGVTEKSTLEFVVKATEQEFVKQLTGLLQDRTLDIEELGLLYVHKCGAPVGDALKALDRPNDKLQDFLEQQKCFILEQGGQVRFAYSESKPASPPLCTINENKALVGGGQINVHVTVKVVASGQLHRTSSIANLAVDSSDTVAQLKDRVALLESLPFQEHELFLCSAVGDVALKDENAQLASCGVDGGSNLSLIVKATEEAFVQQLVILLEARKRLSPNELSNLYCYKHGITATSALRTLGLHGSLRRFLESCERFRVQGGCVTLADGSTQTRSSNVRKSLNGDVDSKALGALNVVVQEISEASFLNVHHISKDTSVGGDPLSLAAQVFLKGLPPVRQEKWLPGLLHSMAAGLEERLISSNAAMGVKVVDDTVQVCMQGNIKVTLRLSPTFWP